MRPCFLMSNVPYGLLVVFLAGCLQAIEIPSGTYFEQGVSEELAKHRAATLSDITYDISLSIPENLEDSITGSITIQFSLIESERPVLIDFNQPGHKVKQLTINGEPSSVLMTFNHIVLNNLEAGQHEVIIAFVAGESSLNRNAEFLYTLFVPDRASFAIPLFDQPDLKASYQLELEIPDSWTAVANGPLQEQSPVAANRNRMQFAETKPIPTYLFAFAAGKFETITRSRAGRPMTLYHRETDSAKVARNVEAIFDLHETALTWLEEYTGIPYPFQKFDFVLVPSFQYGGMEHPGSILYRASSLFLEETATQNQYLGRASLIAHETAHMWFGDLVTMKWFDDVWTKEVFANFMAAKIVNPSFPEIDHELRFLHRHYPSAYAVDRTEGANPIRQPLDNLQEAGTLYGAIIYQKAPIVMRQLELIVGTESFQEGMQEYLRTFSYRNATWPDLIAILDQRSEEDLEAWSQVWVEEPGRPTITTSVTYTPDAARVILTQSDPWNRSRLWRQQLSIAIGEAELQTISMDAPSLEIPLPTASYDYILPNGEGIGYGLFIPDSLTLAYLNHNLKHLPTPKTRAIGLLTLWDAFQEGMVTPSMALTAYKEALSEESNVLNTQRILGYIEALFWNSLSAQQRNIEVFELEALLLGLFEDAATVSEKASIFSTFRSIALTEQAVNQLYEIWEAGQAYEGLNFSESDFTNMAAQLALRLEDQADAILTQQARRIQNPDRLDRFKFIQPALSPKQEIRDAFFASLKQEANRRQEPWVLEAVGYLHHPLRTAVSEKYIEPSLELLEEIQQTGDIFFPKRWLDVTLTTYQTDSAAQTIRLFLDRRPNYPHRLRGKILQSADNVFRAAGRGKEVSP